MLLNKSGYLESSTLIFSNIYFKHVDDRRLDSWKSIENN